MKETWRWYGPVDPITLDEISETGATGIVTSLCHVHPDTSWQEDEVRKLKARIEAAGLSWDVVESIPVPNSVKLGNTNWQAGVDTFCASLRSVAAADIATVCYNFMPTFDWTRTRTDWETRTGLATRFDYHDFASFDLFVLKRPGAKDDYSDEERERAANAYEEATPELLDEINRTVHLGLPGNLNVTSINDVMAQIDLFKGMSHDDISGNLDEFLKAVVPVADELGINLGIHPDDPPFPVFGLPRVVSNGDDLQRILNAYDSPRNGLTFCTGSLGAASGNNTLDLFERFADRVNFLHLRNVTIDGNRSFFEDEHLSGQTDMVALTGLILKEESRRAEVGRQDVIIPMRPDHGQLNARDAAMGSPHGYSYIGRLKGLAELRGVAAAMSMRVA